MRPVAIGLCLTVGACAGCYDWTIGHSLAGAPDGAVDGPREGAVDAPVLLDAPADTLGAADSARPPQDSAVKVDAAGCASLENAAAADETKAEACTAQPSDCMSHTTDECGCTVFVGQAGSPATLQFNEAVLQLKTSGCSFQCGVCPTAPSTSFCIVSNPMLGEACTQ